MTADDLTHTAVVIGAGVSGLIAAHELAQRGVATALVDDGWLGGLVVNVGALDGDGVSGAGADLVNELLGEALEAGVDYRMGEAAAPDFDRGAWRLPGLELAAPYIVLATGARLRKLGVPGEKSLTGRGVSQCAFCDGGLYRGQDTVVVGGGDAAFQEALHLAELCGSVTVLMRGDAPRARPSYVERLAACANVRLRPGVQVTEILGENGVDALRLCETASGAEETLATRAVFVFVGLEPRTELAPADAARDAAGALVVDETMRSTAPGLFAVGAARAGYGGLITDARCDAIAAAKAVAAAAGG